VRYAKPPAGFTIENDDIGTLSLHGECVSLGKKAAVAAWKD
jgi:hypothetical protein